MFRHSDKAIMVYACVAMFCLLIFPSLKSDEHSCSNLTLTYSAKKVAISVYEGTVADVQAEAYVDETEERCTINVTDMFRTISRVKAAVMEVKNHVYFQTVFICQGYTTEIQFDTSGLNETEKTEYYLALGFDNCTVSIESLNKLSRFGKIIALVNHIGIAGSESSSCDFADDLTAVGAVLSGMRCKPVHRCTTLFDVCRGPFTLTHTLFIKSQMNNESYSVSSSFTEILRQQFPNLQRLTLHNVKLESGLKFPWTTTFFSLPNPLNNLSLFTKLDKADNNCCMGRRFYMTHSVEVVSQANQRDKLQLVGNILKIHIIGMTSSFREDFFHNVTGLLELDLSRNALETVPDHLFESQYNLYKLMLQGNTLSTFPPHVFESLTALKYLDLSKNKLKYLNPEIFSNLLYLKEIHLENNLLQVLPVNIFDNQLKTLVGIYLHSNPLTTIPANAIYAPYLDILDLHNSSINGFSFVNFLRQVDNPDMSFGDSIRKDDQRKYKDPVLTVDLKPATMDLSYCQIQTFPISDDYLVIRDFVMAQHVLQFININFLENPLYCACNITILQKVLRYTNDTLASQFTAETLLCQAPFELIGRPILTITREEMYCPTNEALCPSMCVCFSRLDSSSLIIDCRHTNLTTLPIYMPHERLELWFHNSSVREIRLRNYFANVTVLDLSLCKVHHVAADALMQFKMMKTLYLDSNLLATLPLQIKNVNLTLVTLSNNPFLCDCHLQWMKDWLLNRESPVKDWNLIKCSEGSKKGTELIKVEDSKFICISRKEGSFNYVQHAVLPSIVIGSLLFVLTAISLIVFYQRLAIKALLYIYCGMHPFDKDAKISAHTKYDALAVYRFEDQEFMHNKVVDYLNNRGYNVVDMYRDFVVGVSFTENVKQFIRKSQRIIICLSARTMDDELMKLAWTLSYEKVQESISNFIILIQNDCDLKTIDDTPLLRYISNRRFIKKCSPLFSQCLEYAMPGLTHRVNGGSEHYQNEEMRDETFISYPDNIHQDIAQGLIPCLKEFGYKVRIFEFEFVPGGALGEEIIKVIEKAKRVIFVLSNELLQDDIKLMILKTAIAKAMTCDYNFLLVFTHGRVSEANMSSDVRHYVDTHVTTSIDEADFFRRLLCALAEKRRTFDDVGDMHAGIEVEMQDRMNVPLV